MEPTEIVLSGTRAENRAAGVEQVRDGRYWETPLAPDGAPPPGLHHQVMAWAEALYGAWKRLRQRDREHDLIYENRVLRTGGKYHPGVRALDLAGFDASRLFVTTSLIDTFKARMAKRKTMPMFVVDDAEWSLKRQAQDFRRWLHGKLSEAEFDRLYPEIVNDCLVRGDGIVYCDEGDDDIFLERVHRSELLIDPYEANQGAPAVRTIYRFRQVSRDALIARFPEHEAAIRAAPEAPARADDHGSDWLASEGTIGRRDVVDFVESWHLPTGACTDPDADRGGRKVACLATATLCYQVWRTPRFPFPTLTCYKPRRGYWGRGVVELVRGLQGQINQIVADIAMNLAVTGKGIWMVPEAFDVPVEKLTGYRPFKLAFKGPKAPEFVHPLPVTPQVIQLLENLIGKMHDLVGAAQWSAQGRSPLGAGASGIAIDTMEDLLSDRHAVLEEQCAHFRLDVAQSLLDAAGRVAARLGDESPTPASEATDDRADDDASDRPAKKKPTRRPKAYYATWMDKGTLQRLDWNQVALKDEQYRLQLEPMSFLPTTRAGKMAAVSELIRTGVIPQALAASLYDEPDLAHVNRLLLAPRHNAERLVEEASDPTKPLPAVEEWHDLGLLLELVKQQFNRAQCEMSRVVDDERAEVETRLREFGDLVQAVQEDLVRREAEIAAANTPPPPPMPEGPPMGPPGMPPGMSPPGMDPGMGLPPDAMGLPPGLPPGMPPGLGG